MAAPLPARTTIGQLVYRSTPCLDVRRITADLDAALTGGGAGAPMSLALDSDGLALIDVGSSRVGVALVRNLDQRGAAAVVVTVGHGPDRGDDLSLARRQSVLARLIAQRIADRFPPVETLWTESPEVARPATFERLRAELAARQEVLFGLRAERARARRSVPRPMAEAADVARLFARFETALDARRSGRLEPAMALPDDRGPAPPVTGETPLLRLAAHLIDATLMLVALPVGVAMMIYSLSRGADINTSARALAISGTGLSLLHIAGGTAALPILML